MKNTEFVILDVETTGLSPLYGDRIIEFAAVKLRDFAEVSRYETLINPERHVSYDAFLVNGISDDMLKGAPHMKDVVPDILGFLEGSCIVGHNIKFDLKFLNHELDILEKLPVNNPYVIDTVKMARGLYPGLDSYALSAVAYAMAISQEQMHRAMADVEMTTTVFKKLVNIAEKNNIYDIDILTNLYGIERIKKEAKKDKLKDLSNAIESGKTIKILYTSSSSGTTLREVVPKEIEGQGRKAMLVAFCLLRKEERNFVVDKIVNIEKANANRQDEQLYL